MKVPASSPEKLHFPSGYAFSAVAAGIKESGNPDLALAEILGGANAAAIFTTNRVVAAPLQVGRAHLKRAAGRVRAVIVNSGNANCATGDAGRRSCERVCREVGRLLHVPASRIFPASTGVIGVSLPTEKILSALPQLIAAREANEQAARQFARAILTTDTRTKLASTRIRCGPRWFTLLGVAKGSGMIHPRLATMLVYLFTDVAATAEQLRPLLKAVCDQTFNCISVDGDTSTNDTVLLLSSGASGVSLGDSAVRARFREALTSVAQSLAEQVVSDGEGVQHVVRLHVEQARNRDEALRIARAIAHSPLVKTAWAGADPNWGRILAAIGASGVHLDPARINLFFGDQQVCRHGAAANFDPQKAHQYLSRPAYDIRVELGRGRAGVRFLTCDLTAQYVHINADYST